MHKLSIDRTRLTFTRWFVNGVEVSERTYVLAAGQNAAIKRRRERILGTGKGNIIGYRGLITIPINRLNDGF